MRNAEWRVGWVSAGAGGGDGKSTASARWSTQRVRLAMKVCVGVLQASGKPWLTRQDVRDVARLKIGDTGLLDFVLKTLSDKVVDGHLVHREYNNDTKVTTYGFYFLSQRKWEDCLHWQPDSLRSYLSPESELCSLGSTQPTRLTGPTHESTVMLVPCFPDVRKTG
jgi:hypothetical protein